MHLQTWTSILGIATIVSAAFNPADYSFCLPDRGYKVTDGDVAGAALYNELTPASGLVMEPGFCIYRHVNSTIVSLCNGHGRNRTVTRDEVRRGVQKLQKDCGADGSFSGYPVVNNLTFANYGTTGFPTTRAPGNPPDSPGGRRRRNRSSPKIRRDGCPSLVDCSSTGFDGTPKFCCVEPDGHNLLADGSCPLAGPKQYCQSYCEVKRTGQLGIEQMLDNVAYTQPTDYSKGTEISVDTGFDVGASGILKEVFEGSVGFTWPTGVTTTKTITLKSTVASLTGGDRIRWVYFPNLIETHDVGDGNCNGDLTTIGNVCSLFAALDLNGEPIVSYAERIETSDGSVKPIEEQSESYRNVCGFKGPDPDGDGELECAQKPK